MNIFKEIFPIEPFNDLWYSSCWYNSLFPVIHHFKKPIEPFLIKDVFYYEKIENKIIYKLKQTKSDYIIFKELGLYVVTEKHCKNIFARIVDAINNNRCIIVLIDPFFEPLRPEYYQKKHFIHFFLIYGYDLETNELLIIENDFIDSLRYKKQRMKIIDIEKCYYGFLENNINAKATYWEIAMNSDIIYNENYIFTLMKNYKDYEQQIREGINELDYFIDIFKEAIENKNNENIYVNAIFQMLQNIIHIKNMQIYQLKKILPLKKDEVELLNNIYNNFSFVRTIWGRCAFMGIFDPKVYIKSYDRLVEIKRLENEWNNILFSY